ncbi:MAG: 6-phosphogluconolactonase [Cellvibrionaceae bacterium]|jgi:6-phosphogluconolactonase
MAIFAYSTTTALVNAAAEHIAADLVSAIKIRNEAHLVLSGGGTPRPVYERLAQTDVDWSKVHVWFADERNVPPDDPGSNYLLAYESLISNVGLLEENIHRMKGELSPENSAADYSITLREVSSSWGLWPRFDVCILGMGADGHTASLFPGQMSDEEFNQPVLGVTADYEGRPAERTTLTPLVMNASRRIFFLVTGANKAEAIKSRFEEFDPNQNPTQRILPIDGETDWYLDEAAASLLDLS